jgi:excisionase family DNA binding protein
MFQTYPDIVNVDQIAQMLSIGKSSVYTLLQTQQLRHVKVGKKYIVPKQSIVDFATGICYTDSQIINGRLNQQSAKGASL